MSVPEVPEVRTIDGSQWTLDEYDLLDGFVNFAWMANSVTTEPGPLQGWFSEPCHRYHSYVPFNARVQENYYSLAFFLGHDAPWNIYCRHPAVLERLELTLRYTFTLMGENGAIPELDEIPSSMLAGDRMVAAGGFGAEHLAGVLDFAGELLPGDLKRELIEHLRKAIVLVLTSDIYLSHASVVTNQYTGALVAGLKLARHTGDTELRQIVERASERLLDDFISPCGYLYEADGADTSGYFLHTTLDRLVSIHHEWPDPRFREVLRRHCSWMSRWLLPEPDSGIIIQSSAHMTRTGVDYRTSPRRLRGLGDLTAGGEPDERRFLKLLLATREDEEERQREWESEPDPVAVCQRRCQKEGYWPGMLPVRHDLYAPTRDECRKVAAELPCLDRSARVEALDDDRGNQYVLARRPDYYLGFAFADHRAGVARHGPSFLWLDGVGTMILSENGGRACWETLTGDSSAGTGTMPALAEVREDGGEAGVTVRYPELGVKKTYALEPRSILVGLYDITATWELGLLTECVPLLLREGDIVHVGYGRWRNCMGGKLCCYTDKVEIERAGRVVMAVRFQTKVQVWFRATFDSDGFIRAKMTFPLMPGFYGKYGYRIDIPSD